MRWIAISRSWFITRISGGENQAGIESSTYPTRPTGTWILDSVTCRVECRYVKSTASNSVVHADIGKNNRHGSIEQLLLSTCSGRRENTCHAHLYITLTQTMFFGRAEPQRH